MRFRSFRLSLPLLAAAAMAAQAPGAPGLAERVREWNGQALRIMGRQARQEALNTFTRRAEALRELMHSDPAAALSLAFSGDLPAKLVELFPEAAPYIETEGTWSGPVEYEVTDDETLDHAWTLARMPHGEGMLQIRFAGDDPEGLQCGDHLQVRGIRLGDRVVAAEAAVVSEPAGTKGGARMASSGCSTTGVQRTAVLLVTFPGVPAPSLTTTGVWNVLFGSSGRTLNNYWQDASYGQTSAAGDVFGWYTLDALYTCDQTYEMRTAAIRAADADVNFQNYTRIYILFPNPGGCSFAGRANVGCATVSSPGDGTFTASTAWMLASYFSSDQGAKLALHEGGHNLGLMHSRSRDFGAEALGPLNASGTLSEYGDINSGMGSWNWGHYPVEQKNKLGWLGAGGVATVQNAGSFSILPLAVPATGVRGLKVQRGTGNNAWLWLEYRQPVGSFDSTLNSQIFTGATIHYADSVTGSYTDLLDFTPGTSSFADPALAAGATWVDPYSNVSLSIGAATAGALNVTVNYGAAPCTAANPTVAVSPANPSVNAGSAVNYTVTVTNNDTAGCTARAFTLSSALPSGWSTSFNSAVLTLAPGQSAGATMTKQVPQGTAPGTYPVNAAATAGSSSGTGTANCTVLAPPPPLTASVAVTGTTFSARDTVPITATVLSGGAPVNRAAVTFVLTGPDGSRTTRNANTDSRGTAAWSYRFGPKDPAGTYTVTVQATFGGQTATSSGATFILQ